MKKLFMALLIAVCAAASTCSAQPADDAGKAANPAPADGQKAAIDKAMGDGRAAIEKVMTMTPAQRREWMDQLAETQLRALMTAQGLNDLEIQEKVVLFTREQSAARAKVREAGARLRDALADKNSSKEALASLLDQFTAAGEAERDRRDRAEGKLREELEMAQNPRLEGLLQLYGIIGDASWFSGGMLSGMASIAMLPEAGELAKR